MHDHSNRVTGLFVSSLQGGPPDGCSNPYQCAIQISTRFHLSSSVDARQVKNAQISSYAHIYIVEHAIKAAFRLRRASRMAFRRSTESEKLLINFRFIAQSFVMSVSSHVYDVAIGGPFDQFCARITRSDHGFSDAFELSQAHSSLLDDVLSACLLRSHQRAIGDLLRGSLEVVLEFAIMIGNMDEVEEFQMADRIKLLYASFRAKTASLVSCHSGSNIPCF